MGVNSINNLCTQYIFIFYNYMQLSMLNTIAITVFISSLAIIGLLQLDKKNSKRSKGQQGKYLFDIEIYNKIYKFLNEFFLTKKKFRKISNKLLSISVYSVQDVKVHTVNFYFLAKIISIGAFLFCVIMLKDTYLIMLVVIYILILNDTIINNQFKNINFKVLNELGTGISNIRQEYLRLESIPDAIAEAEVSDMIRKPLDEVYKILTEPNSEQLLEEFSESTPFRLLQTFAGVCYLINETGDSCDSNGSSNFVNSMEMLLDEINLEIRLTVLQRSKFGMLEYLPTIPILTIGIIKKFLINILPGISIIYNGVFGYTSITIIFITAIIGYFSISRINNTISVSTDDRSKLINKLIKKERYLKIVNDMIPKKTKRKKKKIKLLRTSLSRKTMEDLYGLKIYLATVTFILSLFSSFIIAILAKEALYTNTNSLSLAGIGEKTSIIDKDRLAMDKNFLNLKEPMSRKDTRELIKEYLPELEEIDIEVEVNRLHYKYKKYREEVFKWWIILISFVLTIFAWFIPEVALIIRKYLIKAESQEDVLQLQTLLAILTNTSCDTLDALYWLEKQSKVHKTQLLEAYHDYSSNPEMALSKLKTKTRVVEFKRIVDKLKITIYQVSLKEAFSDLRRERSHSLRLREITQNKMIESKRSLASPISLIPAILTIVLLIVIPIGILGYTEFTTALKNIQQG